MVPRTLILQYMNVHRAIIVPMSGDPHHVPLPSIALADMKILKDRFTRAIRDSSRMNPGESRTDLIVLLQIIWDRIMLPIIDVFEHVLKPKRPSRIWLCPTAAFTSIALHAAHPFQTKADRSGKEPCLEGLYICSYTPTLSALIRSRQLIKKRVPPSFVAIGQGQPGAGKDKALLAVDSATMSLSLLISSFLHHYFWRQSHTSMCTRSLAAEYLGAPCLSWQAGPYAVL
ncbi:hypothetical protein C8R48DRAFT_816881 [Suillus tomentosus]|nr:hypothetical protein C8R48DRAFT_816881 [Suillus tomentosus]